MKAFICGPVRSYDVATNERIRDACERDGFKTFVPESGTKFEELLRALEGADLVVANLDNDTVDATMAWSLGYATARGKAMMGYRSEEYPDSWAPMGDVIEETVFVVASLEHLERAAESFRDAATRERSVLAVRRGR